MKGQHTLLHKYIVIGVVILLSIVSAKSQAQKVENSHSPESLINLSYCVDPDWMPYEAIRNGVHVGISYDYITLIAEKANIQLDLKRTTSWKESLSLVEQGICHFLPLLNKSPARDVFLLFTSSYFTSPNVLVARTGSSVIHGYEAINNKVLGVVKGYRHEEYVRRYYSHIEMKRFDTEISVMQALSEGKVDLSVGSLLAVNSHIQKDGLNNIQVIGLAQPHDQLRIGVSRNLQVPGNTNLTAELIVERFNRAIAEISEQSHVDIYRQWNNVKYIEHTDYKVFLWPIVLLLVFIGMLLWRTRSIAALNRSLESSNAKLEKLQTQLVDKNRSLEFLSIHDHLTGLYNRNFMVQRAEEAVHAFERFKQPVSLVIMDVDYFKAINDQYGHSTGDRVLQELAKISQSCLREVDLIARWGGEEFLILCPNSDAQAARVLAERIMDALKEMRTGLDDEITCSFGVAELRTGEEFSVWFDNADKSMYRAKNAGRNQISVYRNTL